MDQQAALAEIRAAHISGQSDLIDRQGDQFRLPREDWQELVNIVVRFLRWTTGSPEFNDFEVVGRPSQHFGFVSVRIASNHGVRRGQVAKEVLGLLAQDQHQMLDVAATHDVQTFGAFWDIRAQLTRTLEVALDGGVIDAAEVARLGAAVGEVEARMTWARATAMLNVRNSLTDAQSFDLLALRARYADTEQGIRPEDPVENGRQLFAQCALCHGSEGVRLLDRRSTASLGQ